jgi:hypothetical protein
MVQGAAVEKLILVGAGAAAALAASFLVQRLISTVTAEPEEPPSPSPRPRAKVAGELSASEVEEAIGAYVDEWHERNHSGVNMGLVTLPIVGEVDLMPDSVEKALFKKLWLNAVSSLIETELTVAGVRLKFTPFQDPAKKKTKHTAARSIQGYLRRRGSKAQGAPSTR